jgi:hypothetical protein
MSGDRRKKERDNYGNDDDCANHNIEQWESTGSFLFPCYSIVPVLLARSTKEIERYQRTTVHER